MQLSLSLERDAVRALLTPDAAQNGTRARRQFAPGSSPARMWLDAMELSGELCARFPLETAQLESAAVTFPAPVSPEGIVLEDPRFAPWRGYDLARGLREHLGVQSVEALSAVQARARFEMRFGALQNLHTFVFLDLGDRIESWGRVGGLDVPALHVGAQIIERDGAMDEWGRRGSLNAYCSSTAFEGRAQSYGLGGQPPARLFELASSNFAAQSLCDDFCARLAQGAANAAATAGAPVCLSGSLIRDAWPLLWTRLEPFLRQMWPPRLPLAVFPATGDEDAALWGALAFPLQNL